MTAHLPPQLLALFTPRPPVPFIPPPDHDTLPNYTGLSKYLSHFEKPDAEQQPQGGFPFDNKKERKKRKATEKLKTHLLELEETVKAWDPSANPEATADPYKTLFVGRMSFGTSEHKLKREFENYGPVKKARIIVDKDKKPRGYGFVEFERERDMRNAYKLADGRKIDGRRVVVDVERGRTVRNWRPRRLGGGLGKTRAGGPDTNQTYSGREPPASRSDGAPPKERERERPRSAEREKDRSESRDKDKDRDRSARKRERSRSRERSPSHRDKKRDRERSDRDRSDRDRSDRDRSERGSDRDRERDRDRRH